MKEKTTDLLIKALVTACTIGQWAIIFALLALAFTLGKDLATGRILNKPGEYGLMEVDVCRVEKNELRRVGDE